MSRTALTYADYAAMPDDGLCRELHEGELSVTPAPGTRHQRVTARLFAALYRRVEDERLGVLLFAPTDCILSDTTVVQPDIVFVAASDAARVSERAIEGPPTLAVEVLSPHSQRIDRERKLSLYARHGILHYWIVDPAARTIEAYELGRGGYAVAAQLADRPAALPPFTALVLDPATIWI